MQINARKEAGVVNPETQEFFEIDFYLPGLSLGFEYQVPNPSSFHICMDYSHHSNNNRKSITTPVRITPSNPPSTTLHVILRRKSWQKARASL